MEGSLEMGIFKLGWDLENKEGSRGIPNQGGEEG